MDLAAGSILSLIYRMTGMVFVMLVGVVIAHALSDSDRGIYVSLVAVMSAVGSIAGSFSAASGYYVSNQKRPPAEVASNSILLSISLAAIIGGSLMLVWTFYHGDHRTELLLVSAGLLPMISNPSIGGVFLGMNSIARYSFAVHGQAIAGFVAMLIWLNLPGDPTVDGALTAFIAGHYTALVVLCLFGIRWWGWLFTHRPSPDLIKGLVTFGALTGLAGFISFFNYRIDQFLVLSLAGSAAAGIYPSAVYLAEALWFISTAMAIASYAAVGSVDRHSAGILTASAVRQTLVTVILGAAVVMLLAPWLLRLLYPDHHAEAANALRILCIGTALYAPQSLLSNYYTVQMGRPSIALVLAASSAVINIAVSAALIPSLGYLGGAIGTSISYGVVSVVSITLFLRISGVSLDELLRLRRSDLRPYRELLRRLRAKLSPRSAPAPEGTHGQ